MQFLYYDQIFIYKLYVKVLRIVMFDINESSDYGYVNIFFEISLKFIEWGKKGRIFGVMQRKLICKIGIYFVQGLSIVLECMCGYYKVIVNNLLVLGF